MGARPFCHLKLGTENDAMCVYTTYIHNALAAMFTGWDRSDKPPVDLAVDCPL